MLPPPARQKIIIVPNDTLIHTFDTNDSRVLGAFLENDEIQFVCNTKVSSTGRAGIYHGFISSVSTNPSVTANILGDPEIDFGFPNISYSGYFTNDRDAIITFNHSSPDEPSGFSAFYFANNGTYSKQSFIQKGTSYVNRVPGLDERWGDYTGSQRVYDEPGKVWSNGSFGEQENSTGKRVNQTWVAELERPYAVAPSSWPVAGASRRWPSSTAPASSASRGSSDPRSTTSSTRCRRTTTGRCSSASCVPGCVTADAAALSKP